MVSAGASLSVVIVNYRRADYLKQAIQALGAGDRPPQEIIAVDVQPDTELAPEGSVGARVVVLEDNPGYAAACNRGALEASGDWILFMNADVFVDPTCLGGVIGRAQADPRIGIATCRLVRPDGAMDHACHRGLPTVADSLAYKLRLDRLAPRSHRLGHYRLTWLDPAGSHEIEACSGAFLLIRRDVFDLVGGWDEHYRFYGEDLDLCARVGAAGYRVYYVGTERAVHVKGSSSYLHAPVDRLTPEQLETRRNTRALAIDSHQRYYREHMERDTARPLRPMVRAMFAAQQRRARKGP